MDLDDQAIGSDGNCSARDCRNQALLAGSVRGIGDDRQMRKIAGQRDGGEIDGVSHFGFEGFNSALAEHDFRISPGKQIFGGEQPLFHRR